MTERSTRCVFERLVTLSALREFSGRPSFRVLTTLCRVFWRSNECLLWADATPIESGLYAAIPLVLAFRVNSGSPPT
jgi:hypothetical protein